jgi:hypothetical protein
MVKLLWPQNVDEQSLSNARNEEGRLIMQLCNDIRKQFNILRYSCTKKRRYNVFKKIIFNGP